MKDFDEKKHPRDEEGKFTETGGETQYRQNTPYEEITGSGEKLSPEEKIASVHIDFTRDNLLPELNEESLAEMGLQKNKKVLVKASTIARNAQRHPDVRIEDAERLIGETLYSPQYLFKANDEKPYFSFAKSMSISDEKGKKEYGLVLLDVDTQKENFEVVHWHWVRERNFKVKK